MFTSRTFWSGLIERAVSTFAQALLGASVVGASIVDIDWKAALGIAATAALASVLKAFAAPAETDRAVVTGVPAEAPYTPRHGG